MFKLYKKDGSEVSFTTEEGMEKTLKAFPDKYRADANREHKEEIVVEEMKIDESIPEIIIEETIEEE